MAGTATSGSGPSGGIGALAGAGSGAGGAVAASGAGGASNATGGRSSAGAGMSADDGGASNPDMATATSVPCQKAIGAWCEQLDAGATLNTVDVALDSHGDVILVGRDRTNASEDVLVAKYTSEGQFVWARHFGTGPDDTDYASGLAIDQNDDIVIAASAYPATDDSGLSYPFVLKVSSEGELRWLKQNDGLGSAAAVAIDPHGDIVTGDGAGKLYKHSAAGELLWTQTSAVAQQPLVALADANGNLFLSGQADTGFLTELSPDGEEIWRTAFGSDGSYPVGLALDSSGELLVSGWSGSRLFLARYSATGKVAWSEDLNDDFSSVAGLTLDGSGTILLLGMGSPNTGDEKSITLTSYSPDGSRLRSEAWLPPLNPILLDFAVNPPGDVFIAGGGGNEGIYVFRVPEP